MYLSENKREIEVVLSRELIADYLIGFRGKVIRKIKLILKLIS